jgi:hypothetical protein
MLGIWDVARDWCGGALLGRIIKEANDDEKVKKAICATLMKGPADPKTYLLGILKEQGEEIPVWKMTPEQLYALATARGVQTIGKSKQDLISALR